jgi:hypothetical protein
MQSEVIFYTKSPFLAYLFLVWLMCGHKHFSKLEAVLDIFLIYQVIAVLQVYVTQHLDHMCVRARAFFFYKASLISYKCRYSRTMCMKFCIFVN